MNRPMASVILYNIYVYYNVINTTNNQIMNVKQILLTQKILQGTSMFTGAEEEKADDEFFRNFFVTFTYQ